ncbi:MAG TPA: nuclear transport factor 2 family protein, partial [Polyangiaceae bacterium]
LGPIAVSGADNSATAGCHVRGYHFAQGLRDGQEWMIAGHYLFELGKEGSAWKIRKMTLETFYQTGNLNLLEQAARR